VPAGCRTAVCDGDIGSLATSSNGATIHQDPSKSGFAIWLLFYLQLVEFVYYLLFADTLTDR